MGRAILGALAVEGELVGVAVEGVKVGLVLAGLDGRQLLCGDLDVLGGAGRRGGEVEPVAATARRSVVALAVASRRSRSLTGWR